MSNKLGTTIWVTVLPVLVVVYVKLPSQAVTHPVCFTGNTLLLPTYISFILWYDTVGVVDNVPYWKFVKVTVTGSVI